MKMSRPFRRLAALLAAATLLFAQLAVAAYACEAEAAVAAPAAAQDCERPVVDAGRSPLCHAHCLQGDESLDKPSVSVPGCGAGAALGTLWDGTQPSASGPARELASLLYRATAPPQAVRFCRFRN